MYRYLVTMLTLFIVGCGADVAGTAAISAAAKTQETKQAQQTMEHVRQQLDAAALAAQERATEAEKTMGY